MVECVTPSACLKGIGDEENKEVFEAAIAAQTVSTAKGVHDNHQPSAKFVFKHPRVYVRSSALHER